MLRMLHNRVRRSLTSIAACSIAAWVAFASNSEDTKWIPYSARYTTTFSKHDNSGNHSREEIQTEEIPSVDGALLTVQTTGGERRSAKLWQADGQAFALDYYRKQAVPIGHFRRAHLPVPHQAQLGTKSLLGLECTIYPMRVSDGSGKICIDFGDDLILYQETHMNSGGLQQDIIQEMTSIDLSSPVNLSETSIPKDFAVLPPNAPKQ